MQYIPLADFFGFLGRTVQPVSPEEKPAVAAELEALYASGKGLYAAGKSIGLEQAKLFLNSLSHPGVVVFDQWTMQYSGLKKLLIGGELSPNNFDPKIVREHRLFPDFARFISPFLLPEMLNKLHEAKDQDFLLIANYIHLLEPDGKLVAQDKLSTWLKSKLASSLAAARTAKKEQELMQQIEFVVSDEVIEFVNQFDKSFYATKIAYIDSMLEVMKLPAATQRLGSWIAAQLKHLDLNPEHREKIREITGTVKEGKVRFLNQPGRVSLSFRSVLAFFLTFVIVVGGIFYLVWFKPFQGMGKVQQAAENKSSFEEFTKQERMQLDSLIQSFSSDHTDKLEQYMEDEFLHLAPTDMDVFYREPYKNAEAEQFHADCLKDEALMESGGIDSCTAYPANQFKSRNYPNFKPLGENKGFQPVFLQNETVYQVLTLVFRDEASAPVYAGLMAPGERISFKMNPGEVVLFLPGNDWAAFQTTAASSELPSSNFKHHFCLQDENFKAMLFSPYRLKTVNQKTVKLLLNESFQDDSDFFLLDLYQALEGY